MSKEVIGIGWAIISIIMFIIIFVVRDSTESTIFETFLNLVPNSAAKGILSLVPILLGIVGVLALVAVIVNAFRG